VNLFIKLKGNREKGKGFGEPFRDQCVCRETNQRNNHDLHSYGHAHTPFALHHRASDVVDSFFFFFFNLGLPIYLFYFVRFNKINILDGIIYLNIELETALHT